MPETGRIDATNPLPPEGEGRADLADFRPSRSRVRLAPPHQLRLSLTAKASYPLPDGERLEIEE